MGECPCHPSPSGLWAFSLLPLFRPKLLLSSYSSSCVAVTGGGGEKRGKETVSVFARLLVLVVACWHSGVSNGLATVCHHCTWWKDGLCQLQPRSKRHLASYLAAADASVACTNAGGGGLNILDNGQLQEVQEGFFGHRGRGMVPVPKSGEGGWRRAISG